MIKIRPPPAELAEFCSPDPAHLFLTESTETSGSVEQTEDWHFKRGQVLAAHIVLL